MTNNRSSIKFPIIKDEYGQELDHPKILGKRVNPVRELRIILIFLKLTYI